METNTGIPSAHFCSECNSPMLKVPGQAELVNYFEFLKAVESNPRMKAKIAMYDLPGLKQES